MTGRLLLLGAGGHASSMLALIERINAVAPRLDVVGLYDDDPSVDRTRFTMFGLEVLGPLEAAAGSGATHFVAAVGYPGPRARVAGAAPAGLRSVVLVDPTATVSSRAALGAGTVIFPDAVVGPLATIGPHGYCSDGTVVEAGARLGAFVSVLTGAVVGAGARIGAGVTIGSQAVVEPGVRIGRDVVIGAGAVASEDVPSGMTVVGIPARPIDRHPR